MKARILEGGRRNGIASRDFKVHFGWIRVRTVGGRIIAQLLNAEVSLAEQVQTIIQ